MFIPSTEGTINGCSAKTQAAVDLDNDEKNDDEHNCVQRQIKHAFTSIII